MKLIKYLTVNSRKSARITNSQPALDSDEISMRLVIDLPDALFQKPRLEAKISIPEKASITESVSMEVIDNVEEIIKKNTGLDLKISVIGPEEKN